MTMGDNHQNPVLKYLRADRLPTMFCPGCGIGIVMTAFMRAIDELELDPKSMAVITGIGCTGRIGGYLKMDSLHSTHGRALPAAIGAKAVRPDLRVVVFLGDGDGLSIGGNHLIHAANRNHDLCVIMVNNMIYGLTGGQASPTTPVDIKTTTTPTGNMNRPFDVCRLAVAAGASYVSRWSTLYPRELKESIKKALSGDGFRFVEALSQCPPEFGKLNDLRDARNLAEWITIRTSYGIQALQEVVETGRLPVGEFVGA